LSNAAGSAQKYLEMGNTVKSRSADLSNLQFALLLTVPVLVFLVSLMAYPLGYAFWLSLNNVQYLLGAEDFEYVGFENYVKVIYDGAFWHAAAISVRFTVESVILSIGIGLGLALVMSAQAGRSKIVRTVIMLPWAVSLYGTGVMWFYLLNGQSGIVTTLSTWLGAERGPNLFSSGTIVEILALGNAWNMAPLIAFFLLAGINTIPTRLYHLAQIDRLGTLGQFIHVTLPPLRFTLFVFTSIATMFSFKLFDYINIMSRGGPGNASTVLPYLLYETSFEQLDLGYGAAMSFYLLGMIIASTLLLYFFWGRHEEIAN